MPKLALSCAALLCLALATAPAQSQTPKPPPPALPAPSPEASAAQKYFTDVALVTQDGKTVRFYSDLLKGRVVVINSFYTTDNATSPPMFANLEKLQAALGDRVGKDVFFISISVDPVTDTPERLRAFAQKYNARPGWSFVTGRKENVDWALYKLGMYVESREDHSTILVLGNEATGLWKKAFALAKPEELRQIVESLLADK